MKKKVLVLFLSLLFVSASNMSYADEVETESESETEKSEVMIDNFRGYEWGTSLDDVIADYEQNGLVEGADFAYTESSNSLTALNQPVAGYDAYTYMTFDSDSKLVSAMYTLQEEHTSETGYYEDFCDLVDVYAEKYGEPYAESIDWKDDFYKDDESKWGMAVIRGEVEFLTIWKDSVGGMIAINLTGDNYEAKTLIMYQAPEYEHKRNTDGV